MKVAFKKEKKKQNRRGFNYFFQEESDIDTTQQKRRRVLSSDEEVVDEDTSWVGRLSRQESSIHKNIAETECLTLFIYIHRFLYFIYSGPESKEGQGVKFCHNQEVFVQQV